MWGHSGSAFTVSAMFKASTASATGCDTETCTLHGGTTVSAVTLAAVVIYLDLVYRCGIPVLLDQVNNSVFIWSDSVRRFTH